MSIVALSPGLLRSDPIEITRRPDGTYRGQWSRPWLEYLQAEYTRIGGPSAPTNADLDAMVNTTPVPRPPRAQELGEAAAWDAAVKPSVEAITFPPVFPKYLEQLDIPAPPVMPCSVDLLQSLLSLLALQGSPGPLAALRAQTPVLEQDTFTVTLTGMTAALTGTARYLKCGPLVALFLPTLTGTSNATTATLTGLPAALTPTVVSYGTFRGEDNTVEALRYYRLNVSTTIDLFPDVLLGLWTALGVKSLSAFWLLYGL